MVSGVESLDIMRFIIKLRYKDKVQIYELRK